MFMTLLLFSNFSYGRDKPECLAIETPNMVLALFPIVKDRETWEWYRIERTPGRTEYAWIAEPSVFVRDEAHRIFRVFVPVAQTVRDEAIALLNQPEYGDYYRSRANPSRY